MSWLSYVVLSLCTLVTNPRPAPLPIQGWQQIPVPTAMSALAADPSGDAGLLAGSRDGRLFRSADGGTRWDSVAVPPELTFVSAIAIEPFPTGRIYVGGSPNSTGSGLLLSDDGGTLWRSATLPQRVPVSHVSVSSVHPGRVYVTGGTLALSSQDGGENWVPLPPVGAVDYVGPLAVDPTSPARLFLASDRGLWRSEDSAATWTRVPSSGLDYCSYVLAAGVGPTGLLFASATTPTLARYVCSGIYKLRPAATAIEGAQAAGETVTSFAFDPLDPLWAYASARWFNPYGPVALFRTSDGGGSWQPFDRGLEGQRINRVVVNRSGQRLYALSIEGELFALDRESSPQGGERRSLRRIPARP